MKRAGEIAAVRHGGSILPVDTLELNLGPNRDPRDEAALLLTVGAEIEHALMVQYLYAAYSVRADQHLHRVRGQVQGIADQLIQIAREEMGHLMTVQNILHLIGAPPHFDRQGSPFESLIYPFNFRLEPLSLDSLAKYVIAESPVDETELREAEIRVNKEFSEAMKTQEDLGEIAARARRANDGENIRHVGPVYARLIELFNDPENGVRDEDFETGSLGLQASEQDWGYNLGSSSDPSRRVQVDTFVSKRPDRLRRMALDALNHIALQGEGTGDKIDSHFERFLSIYRRFSRLEDEKVQFVWPVATNPNVIASSTDAHTPAPVKGGEVSNKISSSRTEAWAQLFNFRYRMLLTCLMHFLRTSGPRYVTNGPEKGDLTPRGYLLLWSFDEMRRIKKISSKLVQLPMSDPENGVNAGPPFQLPYTIALPDLERSRWRVLQGVARSSLGLLEEKLLSTPEDRDDPFLLDLQASDRQRLDVLDALADDRPIPDDAQPENFQKVVHILEQSVRGFEIGVHGNIWTEKTRDEFVDQLIFNRPLIGRSQSDDCKLSSADSQLVSKIDPNKPGLPMPRYRPPIDDSRRQYISEWINNQAPDNDPPGQIGIFSERNPKDD